MTTALKLPVDPLESVGRVIVSVGDVPVALTSVYATPSLWRAAAQAAVGTSVGPSPTSRTFRFSVCGEAAAAADTCTASAPNATTARMTNQVRSARVGLRQILTDGVPSMDA